MKKILLISSLLITTLCSAQSWTQVGNMTTTAYSLCNFNGNLYAGGLFVIGSIDTDRYVAEWNGASWINISQGINNTVYTLCSYNGNLYAGGSFTKTGSGVVNYIAKWNGSSWSPLGKGVNGPVTVLYSYNGKLYVGGNFNNAGGVSANNIASWNDTVWSALGNGITGELGVSPYKSLSINSICQYNGLIYVGGGFDTAGGLYTKDLATWNGINWDSLPENRAITAGVKTMCVYNNLLYLGCIDILNYNWLVTWNGTRFDTATGYKILGTEESFINGIYSMIVYNNALYTGSTFAWYNPCSPNPFVSISKYDSSGWTQVTGNLRGETARALCVYNGNLFAGGSLYLNYSVAELSNIPTSIANITSNNSISIFPNPSNGVFTIKSLVDSHKSLVEVYNMLGEKIYAAPFTINHSQFTIDLTGQPVGIYLYRVTSTDGQLLGSGKLIVE